MCCCAKPNINGEPGYSWDGKGASTRPVDPPTLADGDVMLYDAPGRCGGMDSHCHHYRLVRNGGPVLLVKNGGGEKRMRVSLPRGFDLDEVDDNTRYWILNAIYHAHANAELEGRDRERGVWSQAVIDKRIRVKRSKYRVEVSIKEKMGTEN